MTGPDDSRRAGPADAAIRRRLAHPDHDLLEAIRRQPWTSHNIPLTGEETTLNRQGLEPIGDESRTRILRETLDMMLNGSLAGRRLLDLGSLEGGLALEMARDGLEVLGVEGRRSNFDKCQLIADYFDLPNLRFQHLDVRELTPEKHGTFDAVLCCGLLYHLADPFSFLDSLSRLTEAGGVVFVDTHVAPLTPADLMACKLSRQLSEMEPFAVDDRTYQGRWSQEFITPRGEDEPWDSISNRRSFWPTLESLIKGLYHSGFGYVIEIFGAFDIEREFGLRKEFSRTYLAARKTATGRSSTAAAVPVAPCRS